MAETAPRVRPISRASLVWRLALGVVGVILLLNGSLRMSDDVWPFGPMSQYAFSPPANDTIVITRVEGRFADGRRIDLPLNDGDVGIGRAEVEARIPAIEDNPSLLQTIADGWTSRHRDQPALQQVWLVQDETQLVRGRRGATTLHELATWRVNR